MCYWLLGTSLRLLNAVLPSKKRDAVSAVVPKSPADIEGEIATPYVLFSWLLLWLAFLEVNHGENCSQSCLEDTRDRTGGPVASSLRGGIYPSADWVLHA